jgi:hypothetical protein
MILREMLRHEPLCKILLYSEQSAFIHAIPPVLVIDHTLFIDSTNTLITSRQQHLEFPQTHTQA